MTWLIRLLHTNTEWSDYISITLDAIESSVAMGYKMEAAQFGEITNNRNLRESIIKLAQVPFWKRFCDSMSVRNIKKVSILTVDILSLAIKLNINIGNLWTTQQQICKQLQALFSKSETELLSIFKGRSQASLDLLTGPVNKLSVDDCFGFDGSTVSSMQVVPNTDEESGVCYGSAAYTGLLTSKRDPVSGNVLSAKVLNSLLSNLLRGPKGDVTLALHVLYHAFTSLYQPESTIPNLMDNKKIEALSKDISAKLKGQPLFSQAFCLMSLSDALCIQSTSEQGGKDGLPSFPPPPYCQCQDPEPSAPPLPPRSVIPRSEGYHSEDEPVYVKLVGYIKDDLMKPSLKGGAEVSGKRKKAIENIKGEATLLEDLQPTACTTSRDSFGDVPHGHTHGRYIINKKEVPRHWIAFHSICIL